ncbi:MAG: aminotransferase class IV [Pyrinomonadaceae bacterium]
MPSFVYLNGQICDKVDASIKAVSAGLMYGHGVFTTVRVSNSQPFLWVKHWKRIVANADSIGLDLTAYDEETVKHSLSSTLLASGIEKGRARITFFEEWPGELWAEGSRRSTNLLITVALPRFVTKSFRLTISCFRLNSASPLAGIKSCNYLEKILALGEAKARGFNEAIQLNERGHVASACTANVFWLRDGQLFTPSLATGCLAGTTREFVLENFECGELAVGIEDLKTADAIFLTSAGLDVVEVAQFDHRDLPATRHPITELLDD